MGHGNESAGRGRDGEANGTTFEPELSIAQALEAYAGSRGTRQSPLRAVALDGALRVVSQFCDDVLPSLLDPVTRRRLEAHAGDAPRDLLGARHLAPALARCARLLPYHVVAGSGVLESFRDEAPRLLRWLVRRGFADADEARAFAGAWTEALHELDLQIALQRAIEDEMGRTFGAFEGDLVQGHFEIETAGPRGIWVQAGAERRGPVRVPAPFRELLAPGRRVSLAFCRALSGWMLLGAALPVPDGGLDAIEVAPLNRR